MKKSRPVKPASAPGAPHILSGAPAGTPPQHLASAKLTATLFNGPLPPPDAFEHYERTLPGAANRILAMAERQEAHRHAIEGDAVRAKIRQAYVGQAAGFLLAVTAIGGGMALMYAGQSGWGFATVVTAVSGLVGTFVYGHRAQQKELERKRQA
ncbi:MAG: DUF2335 domain-containing protein [Thermodesulfobacteriota bacterium]